MYCKVLYIIQIFFLNYQKKKKEKGAQCQSRILQKTPQPILWSNEPGVSSVLKGYIFIINTQFFRNLDSSSQFPLQPWAILFFIPGYQKEVTNYTKP